MTDKEAILEWLRKQPITPSEAYNHLGCYRLGARIYDLRRDGHHITTEIITKTDRRGRTVRFARYTLKGVNNGQKVHS